MFANSTELEKSIEKGFTLPGPKFWNKGFMFIVVVAPVIPD